MKLIGLFVNEMCVRTYEYWDYATALQDAKFAYEESDIPHEIKFLDE